MKVLKFGGTSVGSPERIMKLLDIINPAERQIVVLSAVSGTTNSLVEIASHFSNGFESTGLDCVRKLQEHYKDFIERLFPAKAFNKRAAALVSPVFSLLAGFAEARVTPAIEKIILAQGELLSTGLYHLYLQSIGIPSVLLPALDFMKTDADGEPDIPAIAAGLGELLNRYPENRLFITQGFICRNAQHAIDNLQRGGSDYTASLIAAAIGAEEVQIWTDIDGMHNNDPRIVRGTKPVARLSFEEAAELAYFGAKILHPQSVLPAQKYRIPVRLLNTLKPDAAGTLITADSEKGRIKSIAAKDGITAVRIQSSRMLLAHGFLRRVFEIFERYKTPIDLITTSEVAVSLTIDNDTHLDTIMSELGHIAQVDKEQGQTIICVVGDFSAEKHGLASKLFEALQHVPIRMISYGGSDYNISLLVETDHKAEVLTSLHGKLFG
jgi:aspartate kinase